jgi:hypothetical protein
VRLSVAHSPDSKKESAKLWNSAAIVTHVKMSSRTIWAHAGIMLVGMEHSHKD